MRREIALALADDWKARHDRHIATAAIAALARFFGGCNAPHQTTNS